MSNCQLIAGIAKYINSFLAHLARLCRLLYSKISNIILRRFFKGTEFALSPKCYCALAHLPNRAIIVQFVQLSDIPNRHTVLFIWISLETFLAFYGQYHFHGRGPGAFHSTLNPCIASKGF